MLLKKTLLGLIAVLIFTASCNKEEPMECVELVEPYKSLMQPGDTATGIRGKVFFMSSVENTNGCEGYFLRGLLIIKSLPIS